MGGLRQHNPEIYYSIVQSIIQQPFFKEYQDKYQNRTQSDIAEEAFVEEFAKLASFGTSNLQQLDDVTKYELFYNAKRVLDTILMGENSTYNINDLKLFNSSLIELCSMVGSELDAAKFKGVIELGSIHRQLANKKQELMKNNELQENCNG